MHVDFERSKAFGKFHTNWHGHAQLQRRAAGSFAPMKKTSLFAPLANLIPKVEKLTVCFP